MLGLFSSAKNHRVVHTQDPHSSSSSPPLGPSAQREAAGNMREGSPSQEKCVSSYRDQASPPSNQQQLSQSGQQPFPPRERKAPSHHWPQKSLSEPSENHSTPPVGAYSWSAKRLTIQPISTLARQRGSLTQSPSPFPRCGHSLPPTSAASGELFLFGGLAEGEIKNDLYSFSTRDLSVTLIETEGDIPPPRVGHASALAGGMLIVWGGVTDYEANPNVLPDDALYLLNLKAKQWTRVATSGPAPQGRDGHVVGMYRSQFFIFGGQASGEFLNDLWMFDLSSQPNWGRYAVAPESKIPAPRSGHVCVTHGDRIYVFGGTDGHYLYGDTWCFDFPTRTWRELRCVGFTPAPREGHAAALVDDVMYIFGGRGVDGKDLGDLAAFNISSHAMAASGSQVFVLGGEPFMIKDEKRDDPSIIHVLDSARIKYPGSLPLPTRVRGTRDRTSNGLEWNIAFRSTNPSLEFRPRTSLSKTRVSLASNGSTLLGGVGHRWPPMTHEDNDEWLQEDEKDWLQQEEEEDWSQAEGDDDDIPRSSPLPSPPPSPELELHPTTLVKPSSNPEAPFQQPPMEDLSASPASPASTVIGVTQGDHPQDPIPPKDEWKSFEAILRSALDDLTHLYIPESRLNIMDSKDIGGGKYGEVLLAKLEGSSQAPIQVAVKELRHVETRGVRQRVALRLARELKIWARVKHPNILPLIGYYLSENYEIARFISPFMTNGNVSQYLRREPPGELKRLDIPNILITETLQAVLCDFGLASFIQESGMSSGLTTSRPIKGSLRYMSPELILHDEAKHTLASDVWAWGCTVFEVGSLTLEIF
ncbi:Negative regulator of mitotic exit [Tulasnella sp. UAMH 9824]|nr:Negative regulator of mitotic exit [Tulasnella sp. UAMH 9824]